MSFPFLSSAWLEEARALNEELHPAVQKLGIDIRMNIVLTDSPLPDSPGRVFVEISGERAMFDVGRLPDADVDLTVSYQTAKEILLSGNMDLPLHQIMTGAIDVDGDFVKLLEFGGLMATDGALVAASIGERMMAFTT